ncbi:MAG: hypothetical protein C0624_01725 [Desulfuromonas sp.]|nr:MAG: hypothetical protein C0624_01725 [Desulfuromonas sp.]
MVREGDRVAIFHSVHKVMKAEKLLKLARVEMMLIPVPRELSSDCGLAIRFTAAAEPQVLTVLREAELPPVELYCKEAGHYRLQSPATGDNA